MSERIYLTDSEDIDGVSAGKRVLDSQPRIHDEAALNACMEAMEPLVNKFGLAIVTACVSKNAHWLADSLEKHDQPQGEVFTAHKISDALIGMALFFDQYGFAVTDEKEGGGQ